MTASVVRTVRILCIPPTLHTTQPIKTRKRRPTLSGRMGCSWTTAGGAISGVVKGGKPIHLGDNEEVLGRDRRHLTGHDDLRRTKRYGRPTYCISWTRRRRSVELQRTERAPDRPLRGPPSRWASDLKKHGCSVPFAG